MEWLRKSAELGNSEGQKNLGICCYGEGPHDYVSAYMWFNIAIAGGNKQAKGYKKTVSKK